MVTILTFIQILHLAKAQIIVTGTGISNFEAYQVVSVNCQARHSNGTDKTTGGDIFVVKITNECEKNAEEFECFAVDNQTTGLSPELYAQMTDNGDGTYQYNYTSNANGNITVSVFILDQPGIYMQFYNERTYDPPTVLNTTETRLELLWAK